MNIQAIYSDGTAEYRSPMEPESFETVTIRLRVYHGEDLEAFLVSKTSDTNIKMHLERTRFLCMRYKAKCCRI